VPATPQIACRLHHQAGTVETLKALPHAIRTALLQQAGEMADRGAFFNAADAVDRRAPFNRFIRAGRSGDWWFVWYEHGGIAYWQDVVLISADPLKPEIRVRTNGHMEGGDLCSKTDRLLDG
jgi:hypothetical protein